MPKIPVDTLDAEQRAVYDIIPRAAERRLVDGPLTAMLPSLELARRAQHLGVFIHNHTVFSTRLKEIVILVVAQKWGAHYPWNSHASAAEKRGVPGKLLHAIRLGEKPVFETEEDEIVYSVARSIQDDRHVPDALYERAVGSFGRQGMAELVGIVGYYTMVSIFANAFELEPGTEYEFALPARGGSV